MFQQPDAAHDQHETSLFGEVVAKKWMLASEAQRFLDLRTCADYRYQSPVPSQKGRVVEGDARRACCLLRSYRDTVRLVITSPPYLDITDYHEDQWLRLWFLGGAAKPMSGQGKDDDTDA